MKYEDFRKQVISAVREAMNTERTVYNDLAEEEPEDREGYMLMKKAHIMGIAKGAMAVISLSEYSYNQRAKLEKDLQKQVEEYKE